MTPDIEKLYIEVFERDPDGDRMTAYKAGQRSVIGNILKTLAKAKQ